MQKKNLWISDNEFFLLGLGYATSTVILYIQFPFVTICISVALAWYCLVKIKKFNNLENWIQCDSVLISCKTLKRIYSSRNMSYIYLPDCHYKYSYNGQEYRGNNISLFARDSMMQDHNEHYQFMRKIKYTIKKGIYVNPDNPEESVVFRNMSFKSAPIYQGGIIWSVILIIIGCIQIVFF